MSTEELIKKDKSFSESGFISKVDNTFIMLLSSIMNGDVKRVKHKLSDDLFNKYDNLVNELNGRNERQMFDELNIKSSEIKNINYENGNYIINVFLVSRYINYVIDKTNGNYIRGINDRRIEKKYNLTFEKKDKVKEESIARKCPSCGANMDVNNTGRCSYCGSIYNTKDYDWILTKVIEL